MILVISPSKTLGNIKLKGSVKATTPSFTQKSQKIVAQIRQFSEKELAEVMNINPSLARLNFERFINWQLPFTTANSQVAIATFKGDVYEGIDAQTLTPDDLEFAQNHLRILSGLYGILRPLDLMQPYRLEMGTKISIGNAKNLYEFWGDEITNELNASLANCKSKLIINLASKEYFVSFNMKKLKGEVVTPEFRQFNNGNPKVVPIMAKRARGLMTRYIVKNRIIETENLKYFDYEGYMFNPEYSNEKTLVFVRHA